MMKNANTWFNKTSMSCKLTCKYFDENVWNHQPSIIMSDWIVKCVCFVFRRYLCDENKQQCQTQQQKNAFNETNTNCICKLYSQIRNVSSNE